MKKKMCNLTPIEQSVYAAICRIAIQCEKKSLKVSREGISRMCGIQRMQTISDALSGIQACGFISRRAVSRHVGGKIIRLKVKDKFVDAVIARMKKSRPKPESAVEVAHTPKTFTELFVYAIEPATNDRLRRGLYSCAGAVQNFIKWLEASGFKLPIVAVRGENSITFLLSECHEGLEVRCTVSHQLAWNLDGAPRIAFSWLCDKSIGTHGPLLTMELNSRITTLNFKDAAACLSAESIAVGKELLQIVSRVPQENGTGKNRIGREKTYEHGSNGNGSSAREIAG